MNKSMEQLLQLALAGSTDGAALMQLIQGKIAKSNQKSVNVAPGDQILVPKGMGLLEASEELERQHIDSTKEIDLVRDFNNWMPHDVMVATKSAIEATFGYIRGKDVRTFFGVQKPKEISITVDIVDGTPITEACFQGRITVPHWGDCRIDCGWNRVSARVQKMFKDEVNEFLDLIEKNLKTNSIYRGKAVSVTPNPDPDDPQSLVFDIFEVNTNDQIFLNRDAELIMETFVVPDILDKGKRVTLFSGSYGNGKTETAMNIGKYAKDKGLVFFYCKDTSIFEKLLQVALFYAPVLIFMEDLDEIGSGEARTTRMNQILNTLDGVQTKKKDLKVIFTTNHEERINKGLRRNGRIDNLVRFENPTVETAAKILESYWSKIAEKGVDYTVIAKEIGNESGSTIAEIAKRGVKLAKRSKRKLTADMALAAVHSMRHQLDFMKGASNTINNIPDVKIEIKNGVPSVTATARIPADEIVPENV